MESSSDSGKVGHVSISSITDQENQPTPAAAAPAPAPANPYLKIYFGFGLYVLSILFMTVLLMLPAMFQNERQSTFKTRAGFFIIGAIVSFSVAILASAILIFTSHCLQSLMKDIHYTIFKGIGYSSATTASFCLIVVMFVPLDLNPWIAYPLICILFTANVFACCYLCKQFCPPLPNEDDLHMPLPVVLYLISPLFYTFSAFNSITGLYWIKYMVLCLNITILAAFCLVILYMTRFYGRKQLGTSPGDPIQDNQTRPSIILRIIN